MFVAYYVVLIGRILSPVDKGCSGMVSGRKRLCTGAAKASFGKLGLGIHAVAWLGSSSGMPGRGSHTVAWLGASSGTLWHGISRYSEAPAQCQPSNFGCAQLLHPNSVLSVLELYGNLFEYRIHPYKS